MKRSMALLLALACSLAAQAQDGPVDKPIAKLGDMRTVTVFDAVSKAPRQIDEFVITVASDQRTEMSSRSREHVIVYDANMALLRNGATEYTPPLQQLAFPLQVGKR